MDEKSLKDLIKEFREQDLVKNLSGESLKYFDNIINNILEIKRLNNNSPSETSIWVWAMFFMLIFNFHSNNTSLWGVERFKDTTNEESK